MSCKPYKDKLEAYCLGLLSEQEQAAIAQHIQSCTACKREWALHQRAARLIEKAFDQNPPAYLRSKVLANLKDVKKKRTHWSFWAAPGLISMVALILIIKMEPGQMMKKQAVETAGQEQTFAAPMASAPQLREEMRKTALDENKEKAEEIVKKTSSNPKKRPVSMQPAARLADFQTRGLVEAKPMKREALADNTKVGQAENVQAITYASEMPALEPAPVQAGSAQPAPAYAPAKEQEREVELDLASEQSVAYSAMAGAGSVMRRKAKTVLAAPMGVAKRAEDADSAAGFRGSDAGMLSETKSTDSKKVQVVQLMLVEIQGKLDRAQVISELSQLDQSLADRIKQMGEARNAQLRLTVNTQGKITNAVFLDKAFISEQLNRYILDEIQSLKFNQPNNAVPAIVIIQIEAK